MDANLFSFIFDFIFSCIFSPFSDWWIFWLLLIGLSPLSLFSVLDLNFVLQKKGLRMKITCKTLQQKTFQVDVDPSLTVSFTLVGWDGIRIVSHCLTV